MATTIASLLIRNLAEVFGEVDAALRRRAIQELFNDDAVFYDPNNGGFHGHDEIDRIAGVIRASHPDFRYQLIGESRDVGQRRSSQMGFMPSRRNASIRRNRLHHCSGREDFCPLSLPRRAAPHKAQ